MTKNYFRFLFISLVAFAGKANAQCTGCTMTISSADAAPHIIASGQTYCVTSTGSMSGPITIQSGGMLCNQGTITSPDIWVAGGTLNNQGTINNGRVLVSNQGTYTNAVTGIATHDSLLITNIYSLLNNYGRINTIKLGNSDNSSVTNFASAFIFADFLGDSLAQFNNNYNGTVIVNFDLFNAYNSGFFNDGVLHIDRDFYNSTGSTFQVTCQAEVDRDWYNSAIVLGATGGCGGFDVLGGTYNSGTLGNSSTQLDICDSGNPPLGLDGPGGTIASTTTYCVCSNDCIIFGIDELKPVSDVLISGIYPNPASVSASIVLTAKESASASAEVMDMMGRKHQARKISLKAGLNTEMVDVSGLAPGSYILIITDENMNQAKQMFTVQR